MSSSLGSHNAKKSALHTLGMGQKALSLTQISPQSSGGHCIHGRGSESKQHMSLGGLVSVPTKETMMCCQKSGKTKPGIREQS